MGIIADLILFHPYDSGHWGFDCLGGSDPAAYDTARDRRYLEYAVARLSAYSNVWWSMANEWSFVGCKSRGVDSAHLQSPAPVWDELFATLSAADPYGRQASIHNGNLLYNHSQPWVSHVSLQGLEDRTTTIRSTYAKPLIWDEVQYEGALPCCAWGSLSAEEMADRFWWGAALGVYVGHSETLLRPSLGDDSQPLWWAKGGALIGCSPPRIRWMRDLWEGSARGSPFAGVDFGTLAPSLETFGSSAGPAAYMLSAAPPRAFHFLRFTRLGSWTLPLAPATRFRMVTLDTWAMTSREAVLPAGAANVTIEVSQLPLHVVLAPASPASPALPAALQDAS